MGGGGDLHVPKGEGAAAGGWDERAGGAWRRRLRWGSAFASLGTWQSICIPSIMWKRELCTLQLEKSTLSAGNALLACRRCLEACPERLPRCAPAEIWSPAGGFYADPKRWKRNTAVIGL